jgi:branched-chain amino acid transport system substrate-binding protein
VEYVSQRRDSADVSRRSVLRTLGAGGLGGLAGCLRLSQQQGTETSSDGGTADPSATPPRTPADTPTDAPENTPQETEPEDGTDTDGTSGDPVRIGLIQPLSGSLEPYGQIATRGFYTYFGYRGADIPGEITAGVETFDVGGTTYEIDVRDSAADAGQAQAQAEMLVESANATVLAGGTSAAAAQAIADTVAGPAEVPYMAGPASSVGLTARNCSPTVFRASETAAMGAQAGANFIELDPTSTSVYIYHADYTYGETIRDTYSRLLEESGLTVAGTRALPQGYSSDWFGEFQEAADANVDIVIGGFSIATIPSMLEAFLAGDYDFRFMTNWGTQLFADVLGTVVSSALGDVSADSLEEAGLGPFPTRYHWNQYDNPIATEANEIHRSAYGTNTDMFTSGMFTGASAIVQAVEQSGSTNRADIVDELTGMTVEETLKGPDAYTFQEYNNQARSPMTIADPVPTEDTEYWDAAIQPDAPNTTYNPDQTARDPSLVDCNLN